jgi:hypothetical protein
MTDKQYLANIRKIKDPIRMLEEIIKLYGDFGLDNYYKDLYDEVISHACVVLVEAKKCGKLKKSS